MTQFHITFAIEPGLNAKQRRHNANELALFDPRTKCKGNELPTNDLDLDINVSMLILVPRIELLLQTNALNQE